MAFHVAFDTNLAEVRLFGNPFYIQLLGLIAMKSPLLLIALLTISLFAETGSGQSTSEIRRIDSYVKELAVYVDRPSAKLEIYADVSKTENPRWRKFRSEKSLEKFRESNEVYDIAYVWRRNGKIVVVNFTFSSGSGDWAHYVFHRFRPNGTLAYVEADLRTFYGYMSVQRTFYYDARGKLLKKRTKYRDVITDKPKTPGGDFYNNKVRIYKTTKRLPFLL